MNSVMSSLVTGIAFGITIASAPGPIFFLIIQRTLAEGFLVGLLCGLGAITADALYALIAAIGLTFIMQFMIQFQTIFAIFGGLFLIVFGLRTIFHTVSLHTVVIQDRSLLQAWLSTMLLTLANPVTMVTYCVIFSALGVGAEEYKGTALSLVGGVTIGACTVIFLLVSFLTFFRKKMTPHALNLLNKVTGFVLTGFGVVALMQGIFKFGTSC